MGRIRVQLPATLVMMLLLIAPHHAVANTQSQQHYAKGLIPFQAGQWQAAYASFTNATKADPDDAMALYYRGISGARLGFLQESIADVEKALQLRPDLQPAVLDLGALYLEAGEYERAQSWLERAYEMPENRFRAALFLGIANYRRGDDAAAQRHLKNAAKDPRIRPVANYYEGLSLLRQGRTRPAKRLLANTKSAMPQAEIASAVKEFDAAASPSMARRELDDKPWSVYGGMGIAYDSNVKLSPDKASIKRSRRSGGESVGRLQIALGAKYRVLDTDMFVGTLGYDLYQGVNFGENDYDISSHRVRADLSTRATSWYQVGLSAFYNYYGRNYQSFFHEGTATPWAAFYEGDVAATQVYYRVRGRDYTRSPFEPFRDSINNAVGVRQLFLLGAIDRVLTIGYQWSDNDPISRDGTDFAYQSHQLDFEFEASVLDWFDTRLGYALVIDNAEHPNSRTGFVHGRNDVQHQIVIHAERPLTQHLNAAVDYFGIINDSNIDEFEYDRSIVSAGVNMQF